MAARSARQPAKRWAAIAACGAALLAAALCSAPASAQWPGQSSARTSADFVGPPAPTADPIYIPDLSRLVPQATQRESLSSSLQILVLLTILTVAPSIVLMMTCFGRIVIVLVLLRQALGTQQLPPSQVLIGLALFLTFLAMAPTWDRVRARAVDPYMEGRLPQLDAVAAAGDELRGFMFDQIEAAGNEDDVYMLYEYAAKRTVAADETLTRQQVPMTALVPAFILSELKAAFILGFRIYLPFLVIDMVIATVLVSMGMMMLPPVLISLPFKLLLFVLADGWRLVAGSLMASVAS
ncbi:Flagellar biosynthetic protein FliP precursor [Phycisphaerae bacterium RAS1]|nr:Flagellar biosynthetic protein FliP precursor [Phycisphaerae bacterium RAS1]